MLGIPIIVGQLGSVFLGFADTLMIGWHSIDELGAASFVNNMFNLAIISGTGFSYGLTPVAGELYGRGKLAEAGRALRCSVFANGFAGVLLTAVMCIVYLNVERLGQPKELLPLIKPYYSMLLLSLVFIMIFNAFKQFFDSITDTRTSMWVLLGGNLLNVAGNYLLINGKWGFPEWGLLGAGVSTLFSRIVMVMVFVGVFVKNYRLARYRVGFFRFGFSFETFRRLNTLGWPVSLQIGMETSSFSLSAVMIGWLGTVALASHQIMCTIATLAFLMYYGMGAAVAVRISHFKGQYDSVNIRRSAYAGFHLIMMMAAVFLIMLFLFKHPIAGLFTDNEEVRVMVVSLVFPMLLYQFGDGLQISFANALRGISDVKPMIWIAFIA
ncbi:Multidrug resistance protein NorM [termite gut metagenome]|uniref:Multidrug resistance protein NorM n=1 Tax=termite gut metagenome TaxID=433724 RepID=A0A5J4QTZ2_9ZZZZ